MVGLGVAGLVLLAIFLIRLQANTGDMYWRPKQDTTYYHQRTGAIKMDEQVEIYSVPLFTPQDTIDTLKKTHKVSCQFPVGTWKQGQPTIAEDLLGNEVDGARFLDLSKKGVRDYVEAFIDKASRVGCDGFEPLQLDVFSKDNGFNLTLEAQLSFSKWLSTQVHDRGMFIGLVDAVDEEGLVSLFDYGLLVDCFSQDTCSLSKPLLDQRKPVFVVETSLDTDQFCEEANAKGIYAIKTPKDFGPGASYCE